jgi:hypothetical protein
MISLFQLVHDYQPEGLSVVQTPQAQKRWHSVSAVFAGAGTLLVPLHKGACQQAHAKI